jgi:hypothetical protein
MAARLDAATLKRGEPVALASGIMQAANIEPLQIDTGAGQFAVSETGTFAYVPGGVFPQERWALGWVDVASKAFEPLKDLPPGAYSAPRISPDRQRAAFNTTGTEWDIWTYELGRGLPKPMRMDGDQGVPIWTPPAFTHLTFGVLTTGGSGLLLKNPDTLAAPEELVAGLGSGSALPNAWHPFDGTLAFAQDRTIWFLKQGSPTEPVSTGIVGSAVDFSPSGDFMAYNTLAGPVPRPQVMVTEYPTHRNHHPIGDGCCPIWDGRGGLLYYMRSVPGTRFTVQVVAVPVATEPAFRVTGAEKVLFDGPFRNDGPFRSYDVWHDASKFLMVRQVPPSEVIVHIHIDQDWFETLNRATSD